MTEEGITKVKLHKQEPAGLVTADTPEDATTSTEKKEDPDELGSEDFQEAADKAQVELYRATKDNTLRGRIQISNFWFPKEPPRETLNGSYLLA